MTMILGKRPTGGIVIDKLVMAIDPSNSMCYRPAVSSTIVRDISGNNKHATTSGTNFITTVGGGFDISTNANAVTGATYSITLGATYSMGMWIYITSYSATPFIFRLFPSTSVYSSGFYSTTTQVQAYAPNAAASQQLNVYATATVNVYEYFVQTFDGSVLSIYRNGTFQSSTGTSPFTPSIANTTSTYQIGNASSTAPPGQFYSAHIYNKALSAAEVSQNFEATRARFGV